MRASTAWVLLALLLAACAAPAQPRQEASGGAEVSRPAGPKRIVVGIRGTPKSPLMKVTVSGGTGQAPGTEELEEMVNSRLGMVDPDGKVLTAVDERVVGEHPGDVFYLAQHAGDRVWRIEAIFAMGRMKYFVGTNGKTGDQRGASKMLKRLSEDSDPVIRAAATSARDLTIEEYRKQH